MRALRGLPAARHPGRRGRRSAVGGRACAVADALHARGGRLRAADARRERVATPADRRPSTRARHGDEGPVRFVSPVIDASGALRPRRRRAASCARSSTAARPEGEEWTEWVETANGDPVYFGGADELQVRSRGVRPDGRLHYVNVSRHRHARQPGPHRRARRSTRPSSPSRRVRRERRREPAAAGHGQPRRVGGEASLRRVPAPRRPRVRRGQGRDRPPHRDRERLRRATRRRGSCSGSAASIATATAGTTSATTSSSIASATSTSAAPAASRKAVVGAHAQGYNSQTTGICLDRHPHLRPDLGSPRRTRSSSVIAWKLALHGTKASGRTRLLSGRRGRRTAFRPARR